jgi:hypothetical protein
MLVIVCIALIAYDRKRSIDYTSQIDSKKEELIGIMSDAEQMIEELNKFSDYIVTRMDLKNEEITQCIKSFEERMEKVNSKKPKKVKSEPLQLDKAVDGGFSEIEEAVGSGKSNQNKEIIINDTILEDKTSLNNQKVIPMNNKFKNVIRLSQQGLDDTAIAKSMNIGKGEVQLIIEASRQM